jgi:ABC-type polysaccharide/polyol phosphate transport system ATPase subunit
MTKLDRNIVAKRPEWQLSGTRLVLDNVGVEFPLYQSKARSLKRTAIRAAIGGLIGVSAETGRTSVRALHEINLEIRAGDRVALVGHNGAGKTTLLRVMAGIYHPSTGTLSSEGHRVPLFDIGLGLDDEATGYENILLRGLVMGSTRKEIEQRTADIADFSGLGEFLDMPVRTYSSGMLVRLLFAIATSIRADILLMDEWLAAGDQDFIDKVKQRLHEFVDRAHILVLASHDLGLLSRICTKAVWLEGGQIRLMGPVAEVIHAYSLGGLSQ